MTLGVLAPLVVFGILGIILLVHVTGGSRTASLSDESDILAAWHADWPREETLGIVHNEAGTAALVSLLAGGQALMWSFGAETVSRMLVPGSLRMIEERENMLVVRFALFDCPIVKIPLTQLELPDWHAQLEPYLPTELTHG